LLQIAPNPLRLDAVNVGEMSTGSLQLTNQGTTNFRIRSLGFEGEHSDDFSFSTDCAKAGISTGASCSVEITFHPNEPGFHEADFSVSDERGGDHSVKVTGQALKPRQPMLAIDPPRLDLTSAEPSGTIRIRNSGGGVLQISQPYLAGKDKNDFRIDACPQVALRPTDPACVVQVTYKPGPIARNKEFSVAAVNVSSDVQPNPESTAVTGTTPRRTPRPPTEAERQLSKAIADLFQQLGQPKPKGVTTDTPTTNSRRLAPVSVQ
jgi:hypothetical protein